LPFPPRQFILVTMLSMSVNSFSELYDVLHQFTVVSFPFLPVSRRVMYIGHDVTCSPTMLASPPPHHYHLIAPRIFSRAIFYEPLHNHPPSGYSKMSIFVAPSTYSLPSVFGVVGNVPWHPPSPGQPPLYSFVSIITFSFFATFPSFRRRRQLRTQPSQSFIYTSVCHSM